MIRACVDTHVLVWYLSKPARLARRARRLLREADALEFVLLSALTDPFDRMVAAAARVAGAPLLTADTRIRESALVETIWE